MKIRGLSLALVAVLLLPLGVATAAEPNEPLIIVACRACHSTESGKNLLGPSLFGVMGRKAGSAPGFDFSPALKGSGKTWDQATLSRYLADPAADVPGTTMRFAGVKSDFMLKGLLEYLARLK